MKRLFLPLSLLALVACTKQKPDWDQVTCKRVTYWQEPFTDSTGHGASLGDSTITESIQFCTSNPYYTSEVTKAEHFGVKWVRVCNAALETLYYNKLFATVKDE